MNRRTNLNTFPTVAYSAVLAIAIATVAVILFAEEVPEQAPLASVQPKQTPHVIYIAVCGALEGIIITTDPLTWADLVKPVTPEFTALENEALMAGRIFKFNAGYDVKCP